MGKQYVKAQAATEFMFLVGFLILLFIIMMGLIAGNIAYKNKKRVNLIGEDIVTKVQKEINLASRVLDGYEREFYIPQKLYNKEYNITIYDNEVVITTDIENYWRPVPAVVGNIAKGTNTIRKSNGIIYLN